MTDENPHPCRSVLFVPADKPRAIEKAIGLKADTLILDLEDAVAEDAKDETRKSVPSSFMRWREADARCLLRLNAVSTRFFSADVAIAAEAAPDGVVVPKVSRAETLLKVRAALDAAGFSGPVWAMIETPTAILNLRLIGEMAKDTRLEALLAGTNDLAAALRCRVDEERTALAPHLVNIVLAARAYGLMAIDGVYNDFQDRSGFEFEARAGKSLGFDGKSLIHPSQVEPANRAFSPGKDEVEWAQKVVEAFEKPENAERGAIALEGRMIERLHLDAARAILAACQRDLD